MLRMFRSEARILLANVASGQEEGLEGHLKTQSEEIISKLIRYGIIKPKSDIDDILSLKTEISLKGGSKPKLFASGSLGPSSRHVNSSLTDILQLMEEKLLFQGCWFQRKKRCISVL